MTRSNPPSPPLLAGERGAEGEGLDVLCVGEALWDLTAISSFDKARSLQMRPGGAAVNVALALAKRGLRAGVAAVIGDDALGDALEARVTRGGVRAAFDRALPRTGILFAERRDDGPRFLGYRDLDEPAPRVRERDRARALLITGLLPSAPHAGRLRETARDARSRGALVLVDVNARPRLHRGRDPEPALGVIAEADIVKASVEDLRTMGIEATIAGWMRDGSTLVTTRGAGPASASGSFGVVSREPATRLTTDALGAGDAFMAGIVIERLKRGSASDAASWDRALAHAHALARALLTRRRGSQPRRIAR